MGATVYHSVNIPVTQILVSHLVYNVNMHQYMYLCLPDSLCLFHPIILLTWKDGFLCVCSSHSTSGPTPWVECLYASVYIFISISLPLLPQALCIVSCIVSCMAVCSCLIHLISVPTPYLACVHAFILIWILFHPLCIVTWKHGCHYVT